jgi:uncharacterized membrane protein YeaQ/YmgE (transglycosylase-associated protein family)
MTIFVLLILGLVAGWIANILIGRGGFGLIGDIIIGILGSVVGGWLAAQWLGVDVIGVNLTSIAIGLFGAAILTVIFRALVPGRRELILVFK